MGQNSAGRLRYLSVVGSALALVPLGSAGCRSLMRQGPVPEAVATCRSLSAQGMTAMDSGELSHAENLFERAVTTCPTDAAARGQYAETLWRRGESSGAVGQIEKALSLEPENAELHARTGEMYLALGRVEPALFQAERALALDAELGRAWALRGRAMMASRRFDRAQADLHRALGITPNAPDLLQDLAELHRLRGQPQRALLAWQALARLYPPGEEPQHVLHALGRTQRELGRTDDAIEYLYAASVRGQPSAAILFDLAEAELQLGHREASIARVRQALSLDPNHPGCQQLAARLEIDPPAARLATRQVSATEW